MLSQLRHVHVPIGLLILIGLATISCSTTSGATNPYAVEYAQAIEAAKSDYVRNILSQGSISIADLKDAEQHVIVCLGNAGVDATYTTDEFGFDNLATTAGSGTDNQPIINQCEDQWMGDIQMLWNAQYANPDNQDWNGLIAACLVRKGLVPEGFTGQDYSDLLRDKGTWTNITASPDSSGITVLSSSADTTSDIVLPGGVSLSDPRATACQILPLQ